MNTIKLHQSKHSVAVIALALLLGAGPVQAVTFDDGGTYTIDNATYQYESIVVQNGTTLIFEDGAVVEGNVKVYDTSTVTIHGGTFGGVGKFSGLFKALDSSTVTIDGGTFGGGINGNHSGTGVYSGIVYLGDSSMVTIHGGTFGGVGDYSGAVDALDSSTLMIDGGTFGGAGTGSGQVLPNYSSTVTIDGGTFGGAGTDSGLVGVFGSSIVTFLASSYDTTLYDTTTGGALGVTFCSQSPQTIEVYKEDTATVNLDQSHCGGMENHRSFVTMIAAYLNGLVHTGVITEEEQDAVMNCVESLFP